MNTNLQQFQSEQFGKIRAIEIEGQPWFVSFDIATAMGYSNASKAVQAHVDEDDKRLELIPHSQNGSLVSKSLLINESGMYSLIIASKLPSARKFKHWVTSEVLPSIRKHGAYIEEHKIKEMLSDSQAANRLLMKLLKKSIQQTKEAQGDIDALVTKIDELGPKADFYDDILHCPDLLPITVIAKDYGVSAIFLNQLLHGLGIQYKLNGTWLLYQKHCNKGYTKSRTYHVNEETAQVHTLWTQRGRQFIYETLGEYGVFPLAATTDIGTVM